MGVRWLLLLVVLYVVRGGECSTPCPHYMFPCNNGQCVMKMFWCDSAEDCLDGSDEKYCAPRTGLNANPNGCDEAFFLCKDGTCIPIVGRCDGDFSCPDNSDEEGCDTTTHTINETRISPEVILPLTKLEAVATTQPPAASHLEAAPIEPLNYSFVAQPVTVHQYLTPTVYTASENSGDGNVALKDANDSNKSSENSSDDNVALENANDGNRDLEHADIESASNTTQTAGEVSGHDSLVTYKDDANLTHNETPPDVLGDRTLEQDGHEVVQADSIGTDVNELHDVHDKSNRTDDSSATKDSNRLHNVPSHVPTHFIDKGLKHKFLEINSHDYRIQRSNAQKWLIKVRDEYYGWGDETARALTALYMSSDDDLKLKQYEKLLMSNQLKLRLFEALMRNLTKPMPLVDLALFINALSVSCENPRNFYGHDLVGILRQRTDVAHKSKLVVPFVYLVLCLNDATTHDDVGKLQKLLQDTQNADNIGIESMLSLAMTCMYRSFQWSDTHHGLATRFLDRTRIQGLPGNVYDLALVAQALNEAQINQDLWNRTEVMNRILDSQQFDGSFGDILSTYYVMPLLSGRSLASFNHHCEQADDRGLVPVEVLKNGKTETFVITYILRYGDPMEMSQNLQLPVKKSSSFFDIMRIAETLNPSYRFKYSIREGKPYVYSIGGVVNDAEKGVYWSLYVGSHHQNDTVEERFEGDIRSLIPSWGQYVVFWLKPVF